VFAAGQPLEDEARSLDIALDGVRVSTPADQLGGLSGLLRGLRGLRFARYRPPPQVTARLQILWSRGSKSGSVAEWPSGRAAESFRTSRLKHIPCIYTTNFSSSLLFLLDPGVKCQHG
jgi:hypothetical protein